MTPEERAQFKAEREQIKRKRAFEDYYELGVRRSVDLLFEKYKIDSKKPGNTTKSVPTLNRPTLFRWANEDKWRERAAERDRGLIEQDQQEYKGLTSDLRKEIKVHSQTALETLVELMKPQYQPGVRRQAADSILDRAGFIPPSRNAPSEETDSEPSIPEGTSREQIIQWLLQNSTPS